MAKIPFGPDEIRMLAQLLEETRMGEIEVTNGDARLRLSRSPSGSVVHAAGASPPAVAGAVFAAPQPTPGAAASFEGRALRSSMAGIAHLQPSPGAPPYVTVGQKVAVGETILTVEAMKTFHAVVAQESGTVREVLVDSGDFVEFDQAIIALD